MAGKQGKPKRAPNPNGTSNSTSISRGSLVPSQSRIYRKFDDLTKTLRQGLIKSCAEAYFKQVEENNGSCKYGTVEQLLVSAQSKAAALDVTRNDINNEIRRIKKKRKEEKEKNEIRVLPPKLYASQSTSTCPRLIDTNSVSDLSSPSDDSALTSEKGDARPPALEFLASVIDSQVTPLELEKTDDSAHLTASANQPDDAPSNEPMLPNRCSFENCGAPLTLAPHLCHHPGCTKRVHSACFYFASGTQAAVGELECSRCFKKQSNSNAKRSASNCCLWPGCDLSCVPESCATCQGPVHRLCASKGEAYRGWAQHSENILCCPKHHPDASDTAVSSISNSTPKTETNLLSVDAISSSRIRKKQKKGGQPKGTDMASQRAQIIARKQARNWLVVEISLLRENAKTSLRRTNR